MNEKVRALRNKMRQARVAAVFIGTSDPHQSDGVAEHWCVMQWFSGFTGTTGCCVVTLENAAFWSDGRYAAQMEREVDRDIFELYNTSVQGTCDWKEWVLAHLESGEVLAVDGEVMSVADFRVYESVFGARNIRIVHDRNFPGELWKERPPVPNASLWELGEEYAGKSRREKIACIRDVLCQKNAEGYWGCSLDDIAWLTNLRGADHPIYPIFHGYLLITEKNVFLCVGEERVTDEIKRRLSEDGITVCPLDAGAELLRKLEAGTIVCMDPHKTCLKHWAEVPDTVHILEGPDIVTSVKCRKNETEQENIRKSNVKESVAVVRFIRHVNERIQKEPVTEYELAEELELFRRMDADYIMPANLTIIAYGENAALPHYRPTKEVHSVIEKKGMLLFDICAHYKTGTTDLTRVIPVGECTEEMREDYTLVLKSHIRLAAQSFVYGITGDILDGIAKSVQWNNHRHFGHGTGHGMGYLTYVHEGPGKIITEYAPLFPYAKKFPLDAGMLFSDEPGVYKPGRYGIRLENDLLVQEDCVNEFGRFMRFETVTFCPFERELIQAELLEEEEVNWVNDYHQKTYEKLSPYLNEEEENWLREKTRPLTK